MKRNVVGLAVVLGVGSIMSIAHSNDPGGPPPTSDWNILSPTDGGVAVYLADIPCAGEAETKGSGFTLEVKQGVNVLGGASGTSSATAFSWDKTIPEPSGGWTANNITIDVKLELIAGGALHDTHQILVK